MQSIPKDENSDVKKSIIRTTIKNENLLARKMEMDKIKKKGNKKKTAALKHKLDRTDKVSGVLSTKIQQSIERARFVQAARKSGWDTINRGIVIKNELVEVEEPKSAKQAEKEEEDAYVEEFFDGKEKKEPSRPSSANAFALLEEAEA